MIEFLLNTEYIGEELESIGSQKRSSLAPNTALKLRYPHAFQIRIMNLFFLIQTP
jgi:hypothetical protein